jgi:hypothetical protein
VTKDRANPQGSPELALMTGDTAPAKLLNRLDHRAGGGASRGRGNPGRTAQDGSGGGVL